MRRFAALLLVLVVAANAGAEMCMSPFVKRLDRPEKYLYLFCVDADAKDNDFGEGGGHALGRIRDGRYHGKKENRQCHVGLGSTLDDDHRNEHQCCDCSKKNLN